MRHSSSNVMPFEQNAEFFYRRAEKQRQAGHFREAVTLLWRAVQAEPDNAELIMELATLYGEMDCPLESTRCLLPLLSRPDTQTYYWINLANNLYAIGNTDGAEKAAIVCLHLARKGDIFLEDAADIISSVDCAKRLNVPAERRLKRCYRLNNRAAAHLNADRPRAALPLIEKSLEIHDVPATQALYAFALSEAGDTERALTEAGTLLHRQGLQTADCLYALRVLVKCAQRERALEVAAELRKRPLDAYERRQLFDGLLPLCPDQIEEMLAEEMKASRYDRRLWHVRAALHYNAGQLDEALSQWHAMLALNPYDALAELYVNALSNGCAPEAPIPLEDVPAPSLREEASRCVLNGTANDAQRRWVLFSGDKGVYRIMDELATQNDDSAIAQLRLVLAEPSLAQPVKLCALQLLKKLGAEDPYIDIGRCTFHCSTDIPESVDRLPPHITKRLVPLVSRVEIRFLGCLTVLSFNESIPIPRSDWGKYALCVAYMSLRAKPFGLDDPSPQLKKALKLSERSVAYYKSRLERQLIRKEDSHDAD